MNVNRNIPHVTAIFHPAGMFCSRRQSQPPP
jgi:hypothetical protein